MNRSAIVIVVVAAVFAAACATAPAPAPTAAAQGESRFLVDPRIGLPGTIPESLNRQFDTAWRIFLSGDDAGARRRFATMLGRNPEFAPAALGEAAIEIRNGNAAAVRDLVQRIADRNPAYTAARIYEAEIALAAGDPRRAYDIYRALETGAGSPATVAERIRSIRNTLFSDLYTAATSAPDAEAIRLLTEALEINAGATDARLLLTQKLIGQKKYEEARRTLDPLVNSVELDRAEVQEALAEIDAGRGRFQESIVRYERLARRTKDPRHQARLDEIKDTWSAANMPPQYRDALDAPALTRADVAVLLYWTVPSVRFAQSLGTPPIAIDVADAPGREELIRAIALGLYDVDPVTRRVGATRVMTAQAFGRFLTRVLITRGAGCARNIPGDPADTRLQRTLAACGIADPAAGLPPDAPISGRTAQAILERVQKELGG